MKGIGMAFKVLVAEDEEITRKHLIRVLEGEGYEVSGTGDGVDALKKVEEVDFDLLITDIKMPGLDGLELLGAVKEKSPATEVIVITGFGSIGSAVEAIRKGAYDYITKPFELDDLLNKVKKIRAQKELTLENKAFRASMAIERQGHAFVAKSEGMRKVLDAVDAMRDSDCNVLLTGETGVGKSLLAKIIHATSRRKDKPLLALNCATLTEELLASELFGHEKGAFTGALKAKPGLVEIADTGTLFLDEISEIPPSLQAKLLRVTEEGVFQGRGDQGVSCGRPFHRGHQPESPTYDTGGQIPRGPLLQVQCDGDPHSPIAGSQKGYRAPCQAFPF